MVPLLLKDGLLLPLVALTGFTISLLCVCDIALGFDLLRPFAWAQEASGSFPMSVLQQINAFYGPRVVAASCIGCVALLLIRISFTPPTYLPHFHDLLCCVYAFVHFVAFFVLATFEHHALIFSKPKIP